MLPNTMWRLTLATLVLLLPATLFLSTSSASSAAIDSRHFVLGGESCGDYLFAVAKDPSLQSLYDAWLAGYLTIATDELQGASPLIEEADMVNAQAWVKAYCFRRASDTVLTAAVRFLETKVRSGLGVTTPDPADIRIAGKT